jgi:hypothetical protein
MKTLTTERYREIGQRGGALSGSRRRAAAMQRTVGSVEDVAREALSSTASTLTPEDLKAIEHILAQVYGVGWDRGYQTGWRQRARKRAA